MFLNRTICEFPDSGTSLFWCKPWTKYLKEITNLKCWLDQKRYLAAGVYLSETPSHSRFLFGVAKQFCMFGIWSIAQCITLVYALHIIQSPPPVTHYIGCIDLYLFTQGGGGEVTWREGRGARGVENTNMTDCISSL